MSPGTIAPPTLALPAVLQKYWGFDTLRPLQREAIDAAVARRDSLVILPTGGGKSLCYQVPPLLVPAGKPALCVVVSPLIALMKDQVDGLVMAGYPAAALNSTTSPQEAAAIRQRVLAGEVKLLFAAPERLLTESFLSFLVKANVASIAIDEAHCISQWGHDFRPEYRRLAELRGVFPNIPLHAYTATATPRVRDDIVAQLGLKNAALLTGRFDRPNLTYRVLPRVDADQQVAEVLRRSIGAGQQTEGEGGAAIVYCMSRKETERLAASLTTQGIPAAAYHAGMTPQTRHDVQEDFANERLNVVVATVAFGMGIDRSDVRCVVHATMPKTIEHYQQETGRAGRDGLPSECVLLYSSADAMRWRGLMEKSAAESETPPEPEAIAAQIELLEHMQRFCAGARCRHKALSEYFGQEYEPPAVTEKAFNSENAEGGEELGGRVGVGKTAMSSASSRTSPPSSSESSPSPLSLPHSCNACDVCLKELDVVPDSTIVAQKIVSCVARLGFIGSDGTPRGYGAGYVADVLRGSRAAKISERGHHQLSTFGLLAEMARDEIVSMISQLVDAQMLARSGTEFPTVITGPTARSLLKGETQAALLRQKNTDTWATGSGYTADGAKARPLSREEHVLFDALRSLRRAIATEMAVPPFIVFSDAVLEDLCRARPGTIDAFGRVRGIGQRKQASFGERFVRTIVEHCRGAGLALDTPPSPTSAAPSSASAPRPRSVKSLPAGDPNRPLHSLPDSVRTAFDLFEKGVSVDEVARQTRRAVSTVGGYLAEFIQRYKPETVRAWVDDATYRLITETSDGIPLTDENSTQYGLRIGAIHQALTAKQTDERELATYEQIRIVVTHRAARYPQK